MVFRIQARGDDQLAIPAGCRSVQTGIMCGRIVVARATADRVRLFNVQEAAENLPGLAWNIKPTTRVPVVLESAKDGTVPVRRLEPARWSLTSSNS
ncbi:SOS response-associated peptidase family protein [Specibacter sp. RAF43]|uniref:SOS response-associated peptidase family protein n=1 Tax=Specibacter sp. RAF43 TaxID=3233057 RepID=UPI003F94C9E8